MASRLAGFRSLLCFRPFRPAVLPYVLLALLFAGIGAGVFELGMHRFRTYAEQERREALREKISLVRHALEPLVAEVRAGRLGRASAEEQARALVRTFRYEDDGGPNYVFMNRMDGTVLVRPERPQDEGTRNFPVPSAQGYVGLSWETLSALRAKPDGLFVSYLWMRPGTGSYEEKLSCLVLVPELDVMIGTGSLASAAARAQAGLLRDGFWIFLGLMLLLAWPFVLMLKSLRERNRRLLAGMRERQNALDALMSSEQRFQALFEESPFMLILQDLDSSRYVDVNRAYCRMTGYSREEVVGKTAVEVTDHTHADEIQRMRQQLLAEGAIAGEEVRYPTRSGEIRLARLTCRVFDFDDRPHVLTVLEDITEQRRAEANRRSLVDNIPGAVYCREAHAPWRMILCSEGFRPLTGHAPAEFLEGGLTHADLVHPEDRERVVHSVEEALAESRPCQIDYRIVHADGSIRWVMERGNACRGADGQVLWLDGVILDTTPKKAAEAALAENEARLRLLLEATGAGFVDIDLGSGTWVFNDRWFAMLGYRAKDWPSTPETWTRLVHPEERNGVEGRFQAHLAGETPSFDAEHRMRHRNGHWVWVHARGVVVAWAEDGSPARYMGYQMDISERRHAQQALEVSQAGLEAIFRLSQAAMALSTWPESALLDVNEAWTELTGIPKDEALGVSSEELSLFVDPEQIQRAQLDLASEGRVHNRELRIRRRNGQERTVLWSARLFDLGRRTCRVSSTVDITDLRGATRALQASEARFRTIFQMSPDGMVLTRLADGIILEQNRSMAVLIGYTDEEAAGRSFLPDDLGLWTRAEDRARLTEELKASGGAAMESLFRRKDGTVFMGTIASSLVDLDGQPCVLSIIRDITDQRRAERVLRESEARLRSIFEGAPVGMYRNTLDGQFLEVNAALVAMFGYSSPEEMIAQVNAVGIGEALWESPEARAAFLAKVLAAKGQYLEEEVRLRRRDGTLMDVIFNMMLTTDPAMDQPNLVGFVEDITERKEVQEAALESERRLRILFEGSPIGVFRSTPEGMFLQVNPALAAIFRYAGPLSMVEEVNRQGIPNTLYEFPGQRSSLLQRLESHTGTWFVEEVHFRRKDGTFMDGIMSIILHADPATGQPTLFGFVQDITEHKRSEREILSLQSYLSNIIDSMPSILVGLDQEGAVTQWNRQAEIVTGVSAKDAVGATLSALLPEFSAWIEPLHAEVIRLGRPAAREKLMVEKAGGRRFHDLMIYPLVANGVQGSVVRIEDVTERTRIQELMIQTEKMMSVGGLAAGMAHEINNPLGIISQAAHNIERRLSTDLPVNQTAARMLGLELTLLQAYYENRQIPAFVASIREAVARASRIVENMLKFSRQSEMARSPVSLPDIVQQAIELAANDYDLKKKFDFKSIEIQCCFEQNVPPVSMVAIEIEQVILNLLKNAAQAMAGNPQGQPPRLTIRIWTEPHYIALEIEDNGPGMSEDVRRRVFEPFFTTKEPNVGTGLGLSVSYMIITQNHNGLIEVASAPGQGARFTIRLPLDSGTAHA